MKNLIKTMICILVGSGAMAVPWCLSLEGNNIISYPLGGIMTLFGIALTLKGILIIIEPENISDETDATQNSEDDSVNTFVQKNSVILFLVGLGIGFLPLFFHALWLWPFSVITGATFMCTAICAVSYKQDEKSN